MADHYKKEKKKHYQDNLHPKTFSAKLHKKQSSPHNVTTLPIPSKDYQVTYSMIHVFMG